MDLWFQAGLQPSQIIFLATRGVALLVTHKSLNERSNRRRGDAEIGGGEPIRVGIDPQGVIPPLISASPRLLFNRRSSHSWFPALGHTAAVDLWVMCRALPWAIISRAVGAREQPLSVRVARVAVDLWVMNRVRGLGGPPVPPDRMRSNGIDPGMGD